MLRYTPNKYPFLANVRLWLARRSVIHLACARHCLRQWNEHEVHWIFFIKKIERKNYFGLAYGLTEICVVHIRDVGQIER